jgi:ABC-2 type transport system ATP-binding protein
MKMYDTLWAMAALTITDLYKTYDKGVEALKGISLSIEEGDFFALLGPNGAGKSTTIGIICSLVNKTSGKVQIFDKDIDLDWAGAKAYIGVVPQEANFNIFEKVHNIVLNQAGFYGMPKDEALAATERALKALELWDKRHMISRALSGGMKRRLMIARAIVHNPRLLILDEPSAGVDIEIRRSMWKFLQELNAQGTTIILTTHYLEEAENLCRNIAIIDQGKIIRHTSMRKLLATMPMQSFILELSEPILAVPELDGFDVQWMDNQTLTINVPVNTPLNDVFIALNAAGVQVSGLRNKANRLEELFLKLTGFMKDKT